MDLQIERIRIEAKPNAFIKKFIEESYKYVRMSDCPVLLKRGDIEVEAHSGLTAWQIFELFMNEQDRRRKEIYGIQG